MRRRQFLAAGAALPFAAVGRADDAKPTRFVLACMTLPWAAYPFVRGLEGVKAAGFKHIAWGDFHLDNGKRVPVLATDAAPDAAKELAKRCRGAGLEPVTMFSTVYPEHSSAPVVLRQRLKQAAAAGVGQVLTFGHTKGNNRAVWVQRFKELAPVARDLNVLLLIKQHGGDTGTGEACAAVTAEVDSPHVAVSYDAGNVLDYLGQDPIPDIQKCAAAVRSFCIKDHRRFPKKGDCGPGLGEIDHYKLLHPVARTGREMILACENVSVPLVGPPGRPEVVDGWARRAREYLELVTAGLAAQRSLLAPRADCRPG